MKQKRQNSTSSKADLNNQESQQDKQASTVSKNRVHRLQVEERELENIIDLFKLWSQEVDLRKKEILDWDQKKFRRWAVTVLSPGMMPETVSGQELAKWHPIKSAQNKVKRLKINPKDVTTRLELVSLIGSSKRDFSTEVYLSLLMQALVACSLGEYRTNGFEIALRAQNTYFSKMLSTCQTNIRKIQANLSDPRQGWWGRKQKRTQMLQQVQDTQKSMDIIKSYQRHTGKALQKIGPPGTPRDEINLFTQGVLRLDDLKNVLLDEEILFLNEKPPEIIRDVRVAVQFLRYLPALNTTTNELITLVIRSMPGEPIGYFLKAQISLSALIFAVGRYSAGERTMQIQKQIQEEFNETYHQYGIAVQKIGNVAKTPLEFTILTGYANVIHYFFRISLNILGIPLPRTWLKLAFVKARKALTLAENAENIKTFQRDLARDWADAGFG